MCDSSDEIYEDLADAAERGELTLTEAILSGDVARAEARALLMQATGTSTIEDAVRAALGGTDEVRH